MTDRTREADMMTPEEAQKIAETLLDQIRSRSALDCPVDDGGLIAAALLKAANRTAVDKTEAP